MFLGLDSSVPFMSHCPFGPWKPSMNLVSKKEKERKKERKKKSLVRWLNFC
jgi:hypothetical protein